MQAIIVQNAVSRDVVLGPLCDVRKAFWADRTANESRLRENLFSFDATRQRHIGTSPNPERYDVPDAQVHLLPGGHFVMDECASEVAELTRGFMESTGAE